MLDEFLVDGEEEDFMKELKCLQCNGDLQIDYSKGIAVCGYCGADFLLENDEAFEKQKQLEEIQKLKKISEFEKIQKKFKQLLKKYPTDYEILWEYVTYETYNFAEDERVDLNDSMTLLKVEEYALKAIELAPDDVSKKMEEDWEAFVVFYKKYMEDMEQRLELERQKRVQEIIKGDWWSQFDKVCLGDIDYKSSRFVSEAGKLYLDVKVRGDFYVANEETTERLPYKRVEVELDDEAFFQEIYTTGFVGKKTNHKRILLINGEKLQLQDIRYFKFHGKPHEKTYKFKNGDNVITYIKRLV